MITVRIVKCKRCGHRWATRKAGIPRVCPNQKCHSPYWNRAKRKQKE